MIRVGKGVGGQRGAWTVVIIMGHFAVVRVELRVRGMLDCVCGSVERGEECCV